MNTNINEKPYFDLIISVFARDGILLSDFNNADEAFKFSLRVNIKNGGITRTQIQKLPEEMLQTIFEYILAIFNRSCKNDNVN